MKLAHIIVPVKVEESSDLFVAQPVTFETMRRAKAFAQETVDVELYTAQYPEDHPILPHDFTVLPDLSRSVLDVGSFEHQRKLPILADVLKPLCEASDADYFIYTNVDIALLPYFYVSVAALLSTHDALVINRRTISDRYTRISEIPLMYLEIGSKHPGYDCFVFQREMLPKIQLGAACIGAVHIGLILYANLLAHATSFLEVTDAHLTFHIGDSRVWQSEKNLPYEMHNRAEVQAALRRLRETTVPFNHTTLIGQYLLERYGKPRYKWLRTVLEADNDADTLNVPSLTRSPRSQPQKANLLLRGIKPIVRQAKKLLRTTAK